MIELPEAFGEIFEPYRYKAYYGGRGSGKSWAAVTALILMALQKPIKVLCCREIQKSIKESVKAQLDSRIAEMGFGSFFESLETEIRGANGSRFIFAGLRTNPDSIKSMEGIDIAWVEEAQRVSQRSLDLLIPTIRMPGSEVWFTWNPDAPTDPVDVLFRGENGPPPNALVRQVNWYDNPWFPEELRVEAEWMRERDVDKYLHVYGGGYNLKSEARVFKNWRVEEFEAPADALIRYGADWGFAQDPTVLIRSFIKGRELFVDYEAWKVGCEIDHTPTLFRTVPGVWHQDADKRPTITADSARPETVSYMRRQGFKILPAIKGPGSLEDGIEFLKSYDIVAHPRCKHLIDELTHYSWKVDDLTGQPLSALEDKNNHTIDALRYAHEAARRAKPKVTFVNPTEHWNGPNRPQWRKKKEGGETWKTL